ncbi:gem-associated protein 7-like [Lethenteron reissneri]|uniref:gem-associated protein 7-like n=1 Tax=Lethenteron reissneri TaxID=7753 RepID=UPI002AB5E5AC|nr:gem-associated protein 7-like [Lethenteron reissneri]
MATPVPVLRLPLGPNGGKGFDPNSARFRALHRVASSHETGTSCSSSSAAHSSLVCREQAARAQLRERFLLGLGAACGGPARFRLFSRPERLPAVLRACDLELLSLLVSALGTPLGVQESALLRASDVLHFSCAVPAALPRAPERTEGAGDEAAALA